MKNDLKLLLIIGLCTISISFAMNQPSIQNQERAARRLIHARNLSIKIQDIIDQLAAEKTISDSSNLAILIDKIISLKQKGYLHDVDTKIIEDLISKYTKAVKSDIEYWQYRLKNL